MHHIVMLLSDQIITATDRQLHVAGGVAQGIQTLHQVLRRFCQCSDSQIDGVVLPCCQKADYECEGCNRRCYQRETSLYFSEGVRISSGGKPNAPGGHPQDRHHVKKAFDNNRAECSHPRNARQSAQQVGPQCLAQLCG